jgi:hypothetical protein
MFDKIREMGLANDLVFGCHVPGDIVGAVSFACELVDWVGIDADPGHMEGDIVDFYPVAHEGFPGGKVFGLELVEPFFLQGDRVGFEPQKMFKVFDVGEVICADTPHIIGAFWPAIDFGRGFKVTNVVKEGACALQDGLYGVGGYAAVMGQQESVSLAASEFLEPVQKREHDVLIPEAVG